METTGRKMKIVLGVKFVFGNQRGQSSIFMGVSMMVFIAFLAFVANIGQVIHDKMLTQAVADAAADLNAEIPIFHQSPIGQS